MDFKTQQALSSSNLQRQIILTLRANGGEMTMAQLTTLSDDNGYSRAVLNMALSFLESETVFRWLYLPMDLPAHLGVSGTGVYVAVHWQYCDRYWPAHGPQALQAPPH